MTYSQPTRRNCGAHEEHHRLLNENPVYVAARSKIENIARAYELDERSSARVGITRIPVVVHVVWNTPVQNISDAQIQSQIDVLNQDFRMTNADIVQVPDVWQSVAADARIEFFLATTDPTGNPTNGITRTQTTVISFPRAGNPIKSAVTGGVDPWPTDRYLNIWISPLIPDPQGPLLGYAQFPGGPAATDGVVILHSAFGTTGTVTAPYDRGRTATHEIGHWLNLFHIWGDDGTGCNGSDEVADTPNAGGPNDRCPTFPSVTCNNGPNGDMFMNYMDYTNDACMFMFTAGQVARMQATLDGPRLLIAPGFAPVYAQGDPGSGIGGFDLKSPADRAFAFDYDGSGKLDHLALYRPGTGTIWILKNSGGSFTPVYAQGDPGSGIGGFDLKSPADRAFAFDYDGSGKLDHLALYRPATGTIWILEKQ